MSGRRRSVALAYGREDMVPIGSYAEAPFVVPKFFAAARVQGVRAGPKLLRVQGEVAVAIAGAESPSETQTLGSYSDWRLIKR